MNTKIIIAATVAAFSLATTAFAAEGNGDPFPFHVQSAPVAVTSVPDTGSAQYQAYNLALSTTQTEAILPTNGQNGAVETANSLPVGAMVGTAAYMQAQSVNRWFAQQDAHRFAAMHRALPNG